ncbi:MAG: bifunctional homocysteine S-methyltransferase/methylenetetrahydrofolate reductase [Anaerolineales bacterium]
MTDSRFLSLLETSSLPLLADGAMGTMLHARGIPADRCFDELNLSNPDMVRQIHQEYLEAGAQLILTNTFGANRFKLAKHGLEKKIVQINRAGVDLARQAAEAGPGHPLIGGDLGPLGVHLAPYGRIQPDEARSVYAEQVAALAEAGADFIVLETMSDLEEILLAVQTVHQASQLAVVASMTFTRDDRTILGDSPGVVARKLVEAGAEVIGVNCSGGPAQLLRLLKQMHQAAPGARLWVKPNAGWPEEVGGRIMYSAEPEYFSDYALAFCEAGARIVGGCCGTTPQHIAAMHTALIKNPEGCGTQVFEFTTSVDLDEKEAPEPPSKLAQKLGEGKFVLSVEMDPPRGLSTHKLIASASLLTESGADIINVADSPMARMRMSAWAVCDLLQRQVGVETTLHFPTRGRNLLRVQGDLLAAHALGIRNVFVVMGDPTAIGDYPEAMDNYDLVPSGLIKLIKQGFNSGLDHSGASIGQPTSFFVGAALNLIPPDPDQEVRNAHRKVLAGADFFLTQPIYRSEEGPAFLERYAKKYGPLEKPVLVGILPLVSARHALFLQHEVPGISIPEKTLQRLEQAVEDSAKLGVELATELVEQTKSWAQGVYLMPQFNRYNMIAELIEAIK